LGVEANPEAAEQAEKASDYNTLTDPKKTKDTSTCLHLVL
jgi:hypothetical protein